jgi:hypothetical protein
MKKIYLALILLGISILPALSQQGAGLPPLVINEVDYDQPSVDSAEFIELYNAGTQPINLGDYTVVLFNGSSTSNSVYDSFPLPTVNLNAGAFFVICSGSGKVPLCNLTDNLAVNMIQNGGSGTTTGSPDAIAIRDNQGLFLVDVISYEGDCIAPYVEGTGLPTADSDTLITDSIAGRFLSIGRFPNGNDTGNNSADFSRMCATPGTSNVNTASNCSTPSSLNEQSAPATISVFPNPSRGLISVDLRGVKGNEIRVTLFNVLGNELRSEVFRNNPAKAELDLNEYQDGIYMVMVSAGENKYLQRIVLRK